uniref:copper resistance CopC family protein n=1 Tax=Actinomadura roseirufa TaxID=2094049 RepID=UPI00279543AF
PLARRAAAGVLAMGVAAGLTLGAGAAPASAHTALKSATPSSGSAVTPPTKVVLTYNDPVMLPQVVITDTKGKRHEAGQAQAVDNTVTEQVSGKLPNGVYTVGWRVVAADGHPVTGSYKFTVMGSSGVAPGDIPGGIPASSSGGGHGHSASGSKQDSGGSSGWLWIGLAAVVLALVVGGAALFRRSSRGGAGT